MTLGAAVVTLVVALIAVLPRVPALTRDGRVLASIRRDTDLWASMPEGEVRIRMGQQIEQRTTALLDERQGARPVELSWMYGSAWLGAGWVLLVVSTAVTGSQTWAHHVRLALELAGIGAGTIGVLLLLLAASLVVWSGVAHLWSYLRARRGTGAMVNEP